MPKKVWFYMRAYNSEQYIRQALDSLISQTEPDWAVWIDDNGSTDSTGQICDEYAARDERFFCYHYKVNNCHTAEEHAAAAALHNKYNIFSCEYAEYVAILDSDDFYHPDFVKVMYEAGKKYNADMVVGGTTMFLDEDPNVTGVRIPPELVIKDRKIEEQDFINLYGSLRPFWGKLYSMQLWMQKNILAPYTGEINNAFDTYQVLKLLNNCTNPVVSVSRPLHFYRVRTSSDYNKAIIPERYHEGKLLYNLGKETAETYSIFTHQVNIFLLKVHYAHIKDLINKAVSSKAMSHAEKIEFISHPLSEELFYQYSQLYSNEVYGFLKENVEKVLDGLGALERAKLKKYFLVRLIDGVINNEEEAARNIWLFSVLCDTQNKFHWGSSKHTDIDYRRTEQVVKALNGPINSAHILAKQELLDTIESNNLEHALARFNFLAASIPLDRETLYFEMYLSLILENFVQAVEAAEIARVFWGEDEEIRSMVQMVYETIENKDL